MAGTTYQGAIDGARITLLDAAKKRYTDSDLFVFACDGVREVALKRPDLFHRVADRACTAGVLQTVAPAGLYVLDVLGVKGGPAITKADFETLQRGRPNWRRDDADVAQHWFPIASDLSKRPQPQYYLWPPAKVSQQVTVQYVADPLIENAPDIGSPIPLEDQMKPAIESYIVFRAESIDDEHVLTQRAQAAYSNFANILGIAEKARKMIVQEGRPQ